MPIERKLTRKFSPRTINEPPTFRTSGLCAAGATNATDSLINAISLKKIEETPTTFEPSLKPPSKPIKISFFSLFQYSTNRERIYLTIGTLMSALSGLSMPIWLLLLSQSLETFNAIGAIIAAGGSYTILLDEMKKLIYSFAIVGAVSLVCGTAYVAIWSYVGNAQTLRIRKAFVRKALRQEAAWFDTHVGDPQELPVLAANSLARIETALGRAVPDCFSNFLSAAGCLGVSFGLDAPLALFMLCILPVIGVCVGVVGCFMRKSSGLALKEFACAGAFASEVLTGMKTIASLRAEKWAAERYTRHVLGAQKHSVKAQVLSKLAAGLMGFLFYLTYTFAFIFGTYQAAQRVEVQASYRSPFACYFRTDCGIQGSSVMVCIYGVVLTAQFIALMNPGLNAINLGRTAAAEIYATIERTPEIDGTDDVKGIKLDNSYDGSIELKHVTFSYPSRPKAIIFNNFNLKIPAGSAVALCGPSGSGKSSMSKLLLRLYDPMGGMITVKGIPLTEINLKSWREQIGYVSQEPSLFPGTIFDNIAAGKNGTATYEEVKQAALDASAHDFIMDLPERYETFYSGSSMQLSGGQIQRICIARALIRNPKVLLLDEATSALDTASEKTVQDALEKIRCGRKLTTVTVAHRLSTIVHSDMIVVIADGEIQECGTHEKLLELDGIYAMLCEGQGLSAAADIKSQEQSDRTTKSHPQDIESTETKCGNVDEIEARANGREMEQKNNTEDVSNWKHINSRLRQYTKPDIWYFLLGYSGGMIAGALPAGEAILFGMITGNFFLIDDADEMRATNYTLSLWFLLLAAASVVGHIAMGVGFGVTGCRLTSKLRVVVFDKLMRYSMGWFDFPEHSVGELTTRLEEDSETASNVTGIQQGQRIQTFTCLVAGMAVALYFSWEIGLIAICCVPLILGASFLRARYAKRESKETSDDNYISPATLLERSFHNIMVLQAYGIQDNASDQYASALEPDARFKKNQSIMDGFAFGVSQFSVFGTFALIFWAGIQLMLSGKLSFTDFFVALLAVMFSSFGAGQTGADFSARRSGMEAAGRIFEISDADVDDDMDPFSSAGDKPGVLKGKIEFRNCHFAYPTRPNAPIYYKLGYRDGFSLDVESCQTVAFTGKSGCGKSTALQLLLRFYKVDSGSILVDDHNLMKLNLGWLRDKVGYVGQMPVLFQGSVRDNILLGKPNATEQEILSAARAANAHDFISQLGDGYDTDIGVGGSRLSGGQRQRIAIARAVVKNPQILVLDEATAALDNASERVVQAALDKMHEDSPRTTLVVAHRLETIKNCNKIVVLDRGGVKEEGSHSQLLELNGIYHALWMKQRGA